MEYEYTSTTITRAAELLHITDSLLAEKSDLVIATELCEEYGKSSVSMVGDDYWITCERQYIYLDEDRAQKYTWLNFVKAARLVAQERGALQAASTAKMSALYDIEMRIHHHVQAAYENVVEVGRCLIEAKESGLIPHGQWEAWVNTHAQMSKDAAGRLMRIAREVAPGSRLAELPISKIQEILALPEPEREPMAERAASESMTVKQLREAVSREKSRAEVLNRTIDARDQTIAQLRQDVADAKKGDPEAILKQRQEYERRAAAAQAEVVEERDRKIVELIQEVEDAKNSANSNQAKIERLEGELRDAEAMAERQSEMRQEAQRELAELRGQLARGERATEDDMTGEALALAVRTFIGCIGYFPHLGRKLQMAQASEREQMSAYVDMIAQWVAGAREALRGADVIEGEIAEEA